MGGSSSRVDESKTNHAVSVPESASKKLYNSIVIIEINLEENGLISGTGFFIKLNIKNVERYYLMTCEHVIREDFIKEKKSIIIYYGKVNKEKKLEIKLDTSKWRIKYFVQPYDITQIEILEQDNINKDKYLLPDLNYKNGFDLYISKKMIFI